MTAVCNKRPLNSPEEQARIRESLEEIHASFALEGMVRPACSALLDDALANGHITEDEMIDLVVNMPLSVSSPDDMVAYVKNALA